MLGHTSTDDGLSEVTSVTDPLSPSSLLHGHEPQLYFTGSTG